MTNRIAPISAVCLIALLFAACGSSSAALPANKILLTSIRHTASVTSEHVDMNIAVTGTSAGPVTVGVSGDQSISHGKIEAKLVTKVANIGAITEIITPSGLFLKYPGTSNIKLPGGATWLGISISGLGSILGLKDASSLFTNGNGDPNQVLALITAASPNGVEKAGTGVAGGVPVTFYDANVNLATLASHEGVAYQQLLQHLKKYLTKSQFAIKVSVDQQGYAREIRYSVPESIAIGGSKTKVNTNIDLKLSDFGEHFSASAPPASSVYSLSNAQILQIGKSLGLSGS